MLLKSISTMLENIMFRTLLTVWKCKLRQLLLIPEVIKSSDLFL